MKVSREVKVGLFMVTGIVLLYLGFNFLKGIDFFSSTHKYYAIYENVDKLTEANQVYLNGYAVGRVSHIQIQQSRNRVIVELNIESDVVLNDSSYAVLNGELLGGRFIQLIVGKSVNKLNPKDTLRSEVAKGLMDFIAENAQPVATDLQSTFKKLNGILDNLSASTQQLDTIFRNLRPTPGLINRTLSTANGNIEGLSYSFKSVAENMNGRLTDLKPTLDNFKTLSDSLKVIELNGTLNKAQQTLAKLNETLSRLNKGDNTLSKLMTEDSLYVNLNKLLVSIDSLSHHFNDNPKHFLSPFGKSHKKILKELKEQNEKEQKERKK